VLSQSILKLNVYCGNKFLGILKKNENELMGISRKNENSATGNIILV